MDSTQKQIFVSGDIAYIRIVISVQNEDRAWSELVESMPKIRREVEELTTQEFGPQVTVRSMIPIRGSIEVMVVIGAIYYAVASYEDFLTSIERLGSQLRRFFASRMEHFYPTVTSTVTLGPGTATVPTTSGPAEDLTKMILLGYIILSHAALLVLFIWTLSKKLQ